MTATVMMAQQNTSLGFYVRVKRVARLLTQRELAEVAGVTPEEVALVETGKPPYPEAARILCRYLGIAP
ncbi:helix-turn-helix domain-containing protein [Chloroflexota bacterium]